MKKCSCCKVLKPETDFTIDKYRKSGLNNNCRVCCTLRWREMSNKFPEKNRQNRKRYYQKHKELIKEKRKLAYNINSQKAKAHGIVQVAKNNGLLRQDRCCVCGNNNTVAHHEDYTKPLEVIWLCSLHHNKLHKQIGYRLLGGRNAPLEYGRNAQANA
jgi:hypothetical protein